jgi:2,4-dienoyl-CoA reductase-like NADH-dependent reductase (Old Yellow Enzyme family)
MPSLFDPLRLGDLDLPNRVLMAPLTRMRADRETRAPTPLMAEQYVQRASAGLIFAEATSVDPMGVGYVGTPGMWNDAHVEGWRRVTDGVHAAGGRIVLQLWHVGRISEPLVLDGRDPISSSAIACPGYISHQRPKREFPVPRALETHEIPEVVGHYRRAAELAMKAGFDGVEIHGANGYLLDQFLQDICNHRTDEYGGSIENRARLHLEVAQACIGVWGKDRVGMHLAPRGDAQGMGDSNPKALFTYLAAELAKVGVTYLFLREHVGPDRLAPDIKSAFGGPVICNEQYSIEQSAADLESGVADAIGFGRSFIANPDLPARLAAEAPLTELNFATVYTPGPVGYTDYPTMHEAAELPTEPVEFIG